MSDSTVPSLTELFSNEQALRKDLSAAMLTEKHCADAAAAAMALDTVSKATRDAAKDAHDVAVAQFTAALALPVESDTDPTPAPTPALTT